MARRSEVYSRNRAVHGLADQIEKFDHAIKAKDLARLLGISVPQMYKLGKSTIPSFRLGTGVRFALHLITLLICEIAEMNLWNEFSRWARRSWLGESRSASHI
jgi:hypothetical protein